MTHPGAREGVACVTGRFQPVHADHLRLFRTALTGHRRLIVGITNPDPGARRPEPGSSHRHRDDANPFTFLERLDLLTVALASDEGVGDEAAARVRVVPFDLGRPEHWPHYAPLSAVQYVGPHGDWEREKVRRLAAAGYRVVEVPRDGPRRAAGGIRAAMRTGGDWEAMVPAATVAPLRAMLAARAAAGTPL